jgi:hypothetical protein
MSATKRMSTAVRRGNSVSESKYDRAILHHWLLVCCQKNIIDLNFCDSIGTMMCSEYGQGNQPTNQPTKQASKLPTYLAGLIRLFFTTLISMLAQELREELCVLIIYGQIRAEKRIKINVNTIKNNSVKSTH